MLKTELGPFLYQFTKAAATTSFTPVADRGAMVRDIGITSVSATDTWIVSCKGKEIMRFRIRATGFQNPVRADDQSAMPHTSFFDFCRRKLGMDPSIPVPLGQTLTIASVAGATANIFIQFEEHDNADLSISNVNHPDGSNWLIPIYTFKAAAINAIGVTADDTQVAPAFLPGFLIGALITSAWELDLLAMFFQGVGVNTFSGAANHQSTTNTKQFTLDSRLLNSRSTNGIPNLGIASAAGSANIVFGQALGDYPCWERTAVGERNVLNYPIHLGNGDTFTVSEEIVGDVTGGADYSGEMAIFVAKVRQVV